MNYPRSQLLLFKLIITAGLGLIGVGIGGSAIADMGELIHFNCKPQSNRVVCELTREPLIGRLQTVYLAKTDLLKTSVQSRNNLLGRPVSRLVLVTQSQTEIPLTRNWARSTNDQLLAQRDRIDYFLSYPQAEVLNVRTHRPGQLWGILGSLGLIGGIVGIKVWQPKR